VTGDGPVGGEPFLQLINGGRPFDAVPCSVRLNDVAGWPGARIASVHLREV
jgi:hypothetical protein